MVERRDDGAIDHGPTRWQRLRDDIRAAGPALARYRRGGSYGTASQRALGALAERDRDELAEKWADEAAEAAVAGNPQRAGYIEHMTRRVLG